MLTAVFELEHQPLFENGQAASELAAGTTEFYDLKINRPGKVRLYSSGTTDVRAALLLNDQVLAENDDVSEKNRNFEIFYLVGADRGFYELAVWGYDEDVGGPYSVTFGFTYAEETEEYETYCLGENEQELYGEWCSYAINYVNHDWFWGDETDPPIGSTVSGYVPGDPVGSSSVGLFAPLDSAMTDFYVRWEKRIGAASRKKGSTI